MMAGCKLHSVPASAAAAATATAEQQSLSACWLQSYNQFAVTMLERVFLTKLADWISGEALD